MMSSGTKKLEYSKRAYLVTSVPIGITREHLFIQEKKTNLKFLIKQQEMQPLRTGWEPVWRR